MNTQYVDQKSQPNLQATTKEAKSQESKSTTEETKYTEAQFQRKLSEEQAKYHKKEVQPLRDKLRDIESERDALLSQVDTFKDNEDVLKQTVADLHGEIEEGIPQEAKEAVTKYLKKQALLNEREVKHSKEVRKFQGDIDGVKKSKLEIEAQRLSEKYGVDKDKLLEYSDEKDMKVYALDNIDVTKVGVTTPSVTPENPEPLPKPETPITGGSDNWHSWDADNKIVQGIKELKK